MAKLIVTGALLAIDEHAVRFACLFEFFFRLRIPGIAVRVILHRQLAVRALDLLIAGAAFDAQNFVIIAFCLCGQIQPQFAFLVFLATRTIAGRSSLSLILYPGCNSSSTELSGTSLLSTTSIASCRRGSKCWPCAAMRCTPILCRAS